MTLTTLTEPTGFVFKPPDVLDAWMWTREKRDADGVRLGQKESACWVERYARVAEMAANIADTWLKDMADHEAGLVAMTRCALALDTPVDWSGRAKRKRCLRGGEGDKLWVHTRADAPW